MGVVLWLLMDGLSGPDDGRHVARPAPLFALGRIVATPGALAALVRAGITPGELLDRHSRGDWGEVPSEDARENELSVRECFRILSSYGLSPDERIWIITESDRSATTFLLPEEY